jgi:hypothetical protein
MTVDGEAAKRHPIEKAHGFQIARPTLVALPQQRNRPSSGRQTEAINLFI